jgi:hypothetical protein
MSLWLCCSIEDGSRNMETTPCKRMSSFPVMLPLAGMLLMAVWMRLGYRSDVRLDERQPAELLVQGLKRGKGLVGHRILSGVDLLPYLFV